MIKIKRVWPAAMVCAGVLVLVVGCGTNPPSTEVPTVRNAGLGGVVTSGTIVVDGRKVPCVTWVQGSGSGKIGGISCDWSAATPVVVAVPIPTPTR